MSEPVTAEARPAAASTAVPVAVIAGLFIASLAMRPQILAIGPLLPFIRDDLGLPAGVAGLLTTIPVLCMGVFAPVGPLLAARFGAGRAFALCLSTIVAFGLLRAFAPGLPLVLAATLGIGIGIGSAGAIPSMIVSRRLPTRPAMGTGAYAGGIVAGSTLASGLAVPLAVDGDWRRALVIISLASIGSIVAWIVLVGLGGRPGARHARRLPWRDGTAWLLIVVFGLQSVLFYGIVSWLPNAMVERGWDPARAGALIAVFNGVGLLTTIGVPLVADRLGPRRGQLIASAVTSVFGLAGVALAPDLAFLWVTILGLSLGAIFPLVLTLPLDVADDPARVGSVAALMLLGGYILSSFGPVVLGAARDLTGNFGASEWILVLVAIILVIACVPLSPSRLRRGIQRDVVAIAGP
ncbi:MAG TPA: MFS transporter [Candidatus Limnocylindrales bacterium]|nr:MFS transporter [Candidatus Limnocylindrales bacterium]